MLTHLNTFKDPLATIRNYFHSGAFQSVVSDASGPSQLSPDLALERKVLLYRAHLGLGNIPTVIQQISPSEPPELQAVKVLAKRLSGKESTQVCLSEMEDYVEKTGGPGKNPMVGAVAATFYAREGLLEEALRVVSGVTYNMEWCVSSLSSSVRVSYSKKVWPLKYNYCFN